jgi:hypothetical protein
LECCVQVSVYFLFNAAVTACGFTANRAYILLHLAQQKC